jgi:DNA-directed RNA polymerase specialized sigma24 family protein
MKDEEPSRSAGGGAEEDVLRDPRWTRLAEGSLSEADQEALRKLAEGSAEARAAYEAFRPIRDEVMERAADRARVRRALAGARVAVRELVEDLRRVIQVRVARALVRRGLHDNLGEEVDDMTQTVFTKLFAREGRALLQWDPCGGFSLKNFVGRRAEFEAAKQSAPRPGHDLDDPADGRGGPEVEAASRDLLVKVWARLRADLTPQGRAMFELLYVEEMPVSEICELEGMSPDAVHQWRRRLGVRARGILHELTAEAS